MTKICDKLLQKSVMEVIELFTKTIRSKELDLPDIMFRSVAMRNWPWILHSSPTGTRDGGTAYYPRAAPDTSTRQ